MKRMSNVDECGVTTWSMREATILTCPGKCVQRPVSVSDAVMSQLPGSGGPIRSGENSQLKERTNHHNPRQS